VKSGEIRQLTTVYSQCTRQQPTFTWCHLHNNLIAELTATELTYTSLVWWR